MTSGMPRDNDQRLPTDKASETARADRAPPLDGAGGPQDSEIIQSAVAALGAPVAGARTQADELEAQRRAGRHPDIDDTDGGWSPTSPPSSDHARPAVGRGSAPDSSAAGDSARREGGANTDRPGSR